MNLALASHIYLLGIGGIGMSALARYLQLQGYNVQGYDRTASQLTDELVKQGIPVVLQEDEIHIRAASTVIYTPAVSHLAALANAQQQGNQVLKRAQVLGYIAARHRTLAVAGTHGKTTTSSMLAFLLDKAGLSPTAFVGGVMVNYNSNLLVGNSNLLVVEADEFDRSFLTLHPAMAVLTSMDADHLDIYGTPAELQNGYLQFLQQVVPQGPIVLHHSLAHLLPQLPSHTLTYGLNAAAQVTARQLHLSPLSQQFDYESPLGSIPHLELRMPGQHNLENALAALTVALAAGANPAALQAYLPLYTGVVRRFQLHIHTPALTYIDDYAHHPAELAATLQAVRQQFPNHKLISIFQPHLFTRTRDFFKDFAAALDLSDEIFLTEIYPARELPLPNITSATIFQQLTCNKKHLITLQQVAQVVPASLTQQPTVVLTLGAGSIDGVVAALTHNLSLALAQ